MEVSFKANPISRQQANFINKRLKESKFVDIICHNSTDEDSIACAKAMQWFLNSFKKPSRIICDKLEGNFTGNYKNYKILDISKNRFIDNLADTILCVDFSSFSRAPKSLINHIKQNSHKIIGLDHHKQGDLLDNLSEINTVLTKTDINNLLPVNYYIDTTSKSCSGIILRFFEALNVKPNPEVLTQLFCGMNDDLRKNKYLSFDTNLKPTMTKLMRDDSITKELYKKTESSLPEKNRTAVYKHLNVLLSLTPDEKEFQESLFKKTMTIANNHFAYTFIPSNNPLWLKLGGDNRRTSAIMSNYRTSLLKKHKKLDSVAIFYPDHNGFRISMHSRNHNVLNFFNYIRENLNPKLQAGGHSERGGGTNLSLNHRDCGIWMNEIVTAANEFFK